MQIKKMSKLKIFNIINTIIILFFVCFYGYRLYYYYAQGHIRKKDEVLVLSDELKKKVSLIDLNNGLIDNKDKTYTYKGKVTNNYVSYSGRIYRILDIDENNNIRMISETSDIIFTQDSVNKYEDTSVRKWLNALEGVANTGKYMNTLNNYTEYLTTTKVCIDKIDDIEDIKCEEIFTDDYVSLLSLNDYNIAGGKESFLNSGENYWLITRNNDNYYWYVANDGGINIYDKMNAYYNLRPILTLKEGIIIYDGFGTKDDPYIIEKNSITTLADINVNKYIYYSDKTWKIIDKEKDKIKLVLDGYVKEDDKEVEYKFSSKNNVYSLSKNTLGYYLNNDFYNSLENKEIIIKSKWYAGKYNSYSFHNYLDLYNYSIEAHVGLLKLDDLFITEYNNVFLLTRPFGEDNDIIYSVNEDGKLFSNFVSEKLKIRPVIYIDSSLAVTGGEGTKGNPYTFEVIKDE